ncbi:MAG: type 1 glutamine amidotransferase [Desulfosarcina sp.]|nr:type 1 glutamine amidotransferase [Desulfobacterales bacterium]
MDVDPQIAICILNGYPRASRENFDRDGVGHPHNLFRDFLQRYLPSATVDVFFVADTDQDLPSGTALTSYNGFIWTGSDLTIYDRSDQRVTRQIALARAIFACGVPMYGSCWGVQMAAVVAGGEVAKNPKGREWGLARDITLTADGRQSPLMAGKPEHFDGFIMHLDEVTRLPPGATLLAVNAHTRVQALEVRQGQGVFWATQYHPEYNFLEMGRLIAARAKPLVNEGFFEREEDVKTHAGRMMALHRDPREENLRAALAVGEDILDPSIREQELRNWIDHLVLTG